MEALSDNAKVCARKYRSGPHGLGDIVLINVGI